AIHLARFGDSQAAEKLVEPADAMTLRQTLAEASERSYPAEWTRLVALLLHAAEMRLAVGEPEGATELVLWHRQLCSILDPRAAKGPVGAAWLPGGYAALIQPAAAWRTEKETEIADQIDVALKEWGPRPAPPVHHGLGDSRAEVSRILNGAGTGRSLILSPP